MGHKFTLTILIVVIIFLSSCQTSKRCYFYPQTGEVILLDTTDIKYVYYINNDDTSLFEPNQCGNIIKLDIDKVENGDAILVITTIMMERYSIRLNENKINRRKGIKLIRQMI